VQQNIGSEAAVSQREGLKAATADPEHAETRELVQTLALLELQSSPEYKLPPYAEKRKDAWSKQRDAKLGAYNKAVKTGRAISRFS
jgi:hypothetical protein